eukprot:SAG22_NODE_642_length_8224_cov_21.479508_3_plen_319_part_00
MGQKRVPRGGVAPSTPRIRTPASARLAGAKASPNPASPPDEPGTGTLSLPAISPRSQYSGSQSARAPGAPRAYIQQTGGSRVKREPARAISRRKFDPCPPPTPHALGKAYNASPRSSTLTALKARRSQEDKPHPSMDIDGDGTISQADFKLGHKFDADGNGILDAEEKSTLQRVMAKEKVGNIMRMLTAARSRKVEELRELWLGLNDDQNLDHTEQSGDDLMKMRLAFQSLDKDGSNAIDVSEIKGLFYEIEHAVDETKLVEAISQMDINKDDTITYDEFKRWWLESKRKAEESTEDVMGVQKEGHRAVALGGLDLDR